MLRCEVDCRTIFTKASPGGEIDLGNLAETAYVHDLSHLEVTGGDVENLFRDDLVLFVGISAPDGDRDDIFVDALRVLATQANEHES